MVDSCIITYILPRSSQRQLRLPSSIAARERHHVPIQDHNLKLPRAYPPPLPPRNPLSGPDYPVSTSSPAKPFLHPRTASHATEFHLQTLFIRLPQPLFFFLLSPCLILGHPRRQKYDPLPTWATRSSTHLAFALRNRGGRCGCRRLSWAEGRPVICGGKDG